MTGSIERELATAMALCSSRGDEDRVAEARDELARLRADNVRLRYLLARQHDGPRHMIYGDDGELQCGACFIDFRRDSVPDIEKKLHASGMRELQRMIDSGEWPIKAAAVDPPD
jgi:hypothetical protein